MKLKKLYYPCKNMWLKKIISGSLTFGLLFNNVLTSFAGILSEDGRYETFILKGVILL